MTRPLVALIATMLLAGTLLAVELETRTLIRAGRLPVAPSSNPETDVSLANIARLGRPDVLVLGTSAIRSALQPDVLAEQIFEATGDRPAVQSVAQPALSLEGHRLLVRGLARQGLIPDLVILGLTPSTMTGYGDAGEWFETSELGRYWGGCHDLQDRALHSCELGRRSALWRWRHDLRSVAEAYGRAAWPRTVGGPERRLTPSGWLSERPVGSFTLEQRIPRLLEVLPTGVPLTVEDAATFAALIEELRDLGASVVAVALPYAPQLETALLERNPAWYRERDAGYAALSDAADLPIIIVERYGDWWATSSQNDLRHLSRRGAGPLTRQLWEMPEFREPVLEVLVSAG